MLDDGRRLEVLAALGIDVYRLRAHGTPAPAASGTIRLVVACAGGARRDGRIAQRLDRAVRALGVGDADVAWTEGATDGSVAGLPQADAYLMCGASVARACSASLPLDRQKSATIAVSADPSEWARDAASRRALWQALKPLARRLRGQ